MGSRCAGFSSCGSRALEHRLSSCGAWALLLHDMWDLPGPGLEPMSPALAGGFLTTVPPGKSLHLRLMWDSLSLFLWVVLETLESFLFEDSNSAFYFEVKMIPVKLSVVWTGLFHPLLLYFNCIWNH